MKAELADDRYDQDVVGPMAMTAADVGLLLDVMAATNG